MTTGQIVATVNDNLIENLGFGGDATHTHERPELLPVATSVEVPTMPSLVEVDELADRWTSVNQYGATLFRLARKISKRPSRFNSLFRG